MMGVGVQQCRPQRLLAGSHQPLTTISIMPVGGGPNGFRQDFPLGSIALPRQMTGALLPLPVTLPVGVGILGSRALIDIGDGSAVCKLLQAGEVVAAYLAELRGRLADNHRTLPLPHVLTIGSGSVLIMYVTIKTALRYPNREGKRTPTWLVNTVCQTTAGYVSRHHRPIP